MNRKAYVACNFNHQTKTEALLKVTGSHVYSKGGNILKMVQNRRAATTDH